MNTKEKDIKFIKEVIDKTNITKLAKEENTTVSNITFGLTTSTKIAKVRSKLEKNIEELEKLKKEV